MDLKERLNRLTSISKPSAEPRSETFSDLRERLDRLLKPREVYRRKTFFPIEELVEGEVVLTPHGESFQKKTFYPLEFRYGEMSLWEILHIPTYPAHLLSRDERLKEMELKRSLFLDVETTGLVGGTGTFVFMVGVGFFQENGFLIHQFFMRDYSEEKASLSLIGEVMKTFQFLVTFNGKYY
ncbi:MAG: ribonuclease H-like domain-containing protein, partial [Thermodesulfobacteriota bacterium]